MDTNTQRHSAALLCAFALYAIAVVTGCTSAKDNARHAALRVMVEQPVDDHELRNIPELQHALRNGKDAPEGLAEGAPKLSLREAIGYAVSGNREILSAIYNPLQAQQTLKAAQAAYDPSVIATASRSHTDRPVQSILDTGTAVGNLVEERGLAKAGISQPLPTGGTVSISQEFINYLNSDSELVVPNPQSSSRLTGELKQPILKGVGGVETRSAIHIAELNLNVSREDLRRTVTDVMVNVIKAYWQLCFDREFVGISQRTVDMAEEVYRRERVRFERGISKEVDLARARTAAELRQSVLQRARTQVRNSSEQLKLLLNSPALLPRTGEDILPTDNPYAEAVAIDHGTALITALARRPEAERARQVVQVNKVRGELAGNQKLPKLDALLSYSINGLGTRIDEGINNVYSRGRYSWAVGLDFEWPIGSRKSQAEHMRELLAYDQALEEQRKISEQISYELRIIIDQLRLNYEEVATNRRAKIAAARVVVGENSRFELGQITNEELLRAQDLLAGAERDYAQAVVNYNANLASFARAEGTLLEKYGIRIAGE